MHRNRTLSLTRRFTCCHKFTQYFLVQTPTIMQLSFIVQKFLKSSYQTNQQTAAVSTSSNRVMYNKTINNKTKCIITNLSELLKWLNYAIMRSIFSTMVYNTMHRLRCSALWFCTTARFHVAARLTSGYTLSLFAKRTVSEHWKTAPTSW